jgi:L-threonylcarbamoyladenylate synthase
MIAADRMRPAVHRLAEDGFIAYPTETVWGLGACADRPLAIARLMAWKGRASDAPMSVLVSSVDTARRLGCQVEGAALRLAEAFWPGPLTLVVCCDRRFAPGVARDDGGLGLRCSSHPVANALTFAVEAAGLGPLTSTSMNRTGERPAADWREAQSIAGGEGDAPSPLLVALAAEQAGIAEPEADRSSDAGGAKPSSVVDCTGTDPKILRVGAIDSKRLESVWLGLAKEKQQGMTG